MMVVRWWTVDKFRNHSLIFNVTYKNTPPPHQVQIIINIETVSVQCSETQGLAKRCNIDSVRADAAYEQVKIRKCKFKSLQFPFCLKRLSLVAVEWTYTALGGKKINLLYS